MKKTLPLLLAALITISSVSAEEPITVPADDSAVIVGSTAVEAAPDAEIKAIPDAVIPDETDPGSVIPEETVIADPGSDEGPAVETEDTPKDPDPQGFDRADCDTVHAEGQAETHSSNDSPATRIFTIEDAEKGPLTVVFTGWEGQDVSAIGSALKANHGNRARVEDRSIADAEKLVEKGYDSALCWAAASANMLWTSGWAQKAVDPNTGEHFASEDAVFKVFAQRFEDLPGDAQYGIPWFFTGVNSQQNEEDAAHIRSISENDGWLREMLPDSDTLQYYNFDLGDPFDDLKKLSSGDYTAGISFYSIDADGNEYGGHALTLAGYMTDADGNIASLLIIDNEDDMETASEKTPVESRPNVFTVCDLFYDPDLGYYIEYYDGWKSPLTDCVLLRRCSEEAASIITETDPQATMNAITSPDLTIDHLWTAMEESGMNECFEFKAGDSIHLCFTSYNKSYTAVDAPFVANVRIYKDGSDEPMLIVVPIDPADGLGSLQTLLSGCDLSGKGLTAGRYRLNIELDPAGTDGHMITEAYYLNNTSADIFFTILAQAVAKSSGTAVRSLIMLIGENNNICDLSMLTQDHPAYLLETNRTPRHVAALYVRPQEEIAFVPVPDEAYAITADPVSGTAVIALTRDYMAALGEGTHTFRADISGTTRDANITIIDSAAA